HVKDAGMEEFIKESVAWGDLKKTLTVTELEGKTIVIDSNGQAVPGVEVQPETVSFKVEV
nr:hypothetical protein [Bacillus subtilis]